MYETLEVENEGPIGRITLNRPDKLNPLSAQTLAELAAAARRFDERPDVKVVIVGGAGRGFSAGADLASFAALESSALRDAADPLHER